MPPKEPYVLMDWVRLFFLLPAIIFSNLCFFVYVAAGMGSAPGQDNFGIHVFLVPIPFCLFYIGILCKSSLELRLASLLAVFLWLLFLLLGLPGFIMSYSSATRRQNLLYGFHFLLIGCCAVCALLGQTFRRFISSRNSNEQSLSILHSKES